MTAHFAPESLLFGESTNGALVHISEVPAGLACCCRCPSCRTPLVARKGDQVGHHFGHYAAGQRACHSAPETALHRFAKELLASKLAFVLPALHQDDERRTRYTGGLYRFDVAALECRLDIIIPDVIVRRGDRDLLVEFCVTHACNPDKIAKIASLGIAAVEVDLSGLTVNASRQELEDAI